MEYISINDAFKKNIDDQVFLLGKVSNKEEAPFYIGSFEYLNRLNAVYYLVVAPDYIKAKNEFYKVGMVNAFRYEKLNEEVFNVMKTFTYPLMSDCMSLINRYLSYDRTEYTDSFSAHFGKAIQAVLRNDNVALKVHIDGLVKRSKKGWARHYLGLITAFEGFLVKDQVLIEKAIYEILEQHDKQEQPPIVKDYINLEATAIAKLAWRHGLKVDINSNLVPKELLPIDELPYYEGYEFFTELE